jgi:hypothetical protein
MPNEYRFSGYEQWMLDAFSLAEEHPVRKGLDEILNELIKAESSNVSGPGLSSEERHYFAGRLSALQDMYFAMQNLYADALKERSPDSDLEI